MPSLKNSKPKQGMTLHKFIATGGKPSAYKGATKNAVANKKGAKK